MRKVKNIQLEQEKQYSYDKELVVKMAFVITCEQMDNVYTLLYRLYRVNDCCDDKRDTCRVDQ